MKIIYHKNKPPEEKQLEKYIQAFLKSLNCLYKEDNKEFRFKKSFVIDNFRYLIYLYGIDKDNLVPEYSDSFCINILRDKNFYFMKNTVMIKKENIVSNFSSFTKKLMNEKTYLSYEKRVRKRKKGDRRVNYVKPVYICSNSLKDAGMIIRALVKQGF